MGRTPLQYACSRGQEAAAMLLLLHGANADCDLMSVKDTFDGRGSSMPRGAVAPSLTPLHMAAIAGKARVVCLVLDCACEGGSTQGDQKYVGGRYTTVIPFIKLIW